MTGKNLLSNGSAPILWRPLHPPGADEEDSTK
jgi:hypothetical protein